MEQRIILYAILFGSGMLLYRLLRQKHTDGARAFQSTCAVLLACAGLIQPENTTYFFGAISAFVFLVVFPAILLRYALQPGSRASRIASFLLPYFWWGTNGTALQLIAYAYASIQAEDFPMATKRLQSLGAMKLPPGLRMHAISLDVLLSATQFEWSRVLEKVSRTPNHPGVQLPAARALAELGQATAALNVLQASLHRPMIAKAQAQLYGVELAAYCGARDLDAVRSTLERINEEGVKVPPGFGPYWVGRCHFARGELEQAGPYLEEAAAVFAKTYESGSNFAGLRAAHRFARELLDTPYIDAPLLEISPGYEPAKKAYLKHLAMMRPWILFFGGRHSTPVINGIILISAIVLAPFYLGMQNLYMELVEHYSNQSVLVFQNGEYHRLLTANFLHAGFLHFGFNAFALILFGRPVERTWGSKTTFFVLLFSGVGGHLVSALFHPDGGSIGASTGVYGILAIYVLSFARYRAPGLEHFRNQRITFLVLLILCDISLSLTEPMIDTPGHVGGLLVGATVGMFVMFRERPTLNKKKGVGG